MVPAGPDRHGGHDGRWTLPPDGADRREEGRSRRHAVVHDDHRSAFADAPAAAPPIRALAALELRRLPGLHVAETGGRDAERPDQISVENFDAPRGDRSDCELLLSGSAELPDDEDSSGAPRARAISNPTGTPPRGKASTSTSGRPAKRDSAPARRRPASLRSRKRSRAARVF